MAKKIIPLNLDELASSQKVITLDGVSHEMREMTVQEFINKAKETKEVRPDADIPFSEKIEKLVEMIHDAFPTITKERLGQLSFDSLYAVMNFTMKTPEEIETEVSKAAAGNA